MGPGNYRVKYLTTNHCNWNMPCPQKLMRGILHLVFKLMVQSVVWRLRLKVVLNLLSFYALLKGVLLWTLLKICPMMKWAWTMVSLKSLAKLPLTYFGSGLKQSWELFNILPCYISLTCYLTPQLCRSLIYSLYPLHLASSHLASANLVPPGWNILIAFYYLAVQIIAGNLHFTYITPGGTDTSLTSSWLLGEYLNFQGLDE